MSGRRTDMRDGRLDEALVGHLVERHERGAVRRYERLWDYYRNDLDFGAGDAQRPYRAAQERGLPERLRGTLGAAGRYAGVERERKEVVIENDIAWRLHTMVDFMFGRPLRIESCAADEAKARTIERALDAMFAANGGMCFFQDLALLGGVYGFVDVLVREESAERSRGGYAGDAARSRGGVQRAGRGGSGTAGSVPRASASRSIESEASVEAASKVVLETVEAPRAIPVLDPTDYRRLEGYILQYEQVLNRLEHGSVMKRLTSWAGKGRTRRARVKVTEVWTERWVQVYVDGKLVSERTNGEGRLPVAHMQNLPQPFYYEGLSEVEALIGLQDELNTRLSDRANRVTLQSFKMYLGKGIEGFTERPVGPGQMWMTHNDDAEIKEFGGDGSAPSETQHITEIREAMDKASGVSGLAAGLLRGKVGNLTSENALRLVLMGLLAKTEKKRVTYGQGIAKVCELALGRLDRMGVLRTGAHEREVRLHWPSALPEHETQRLKDAEVKLRLGVERSRVLAELGYGDCDYSEAS